MNRSKMRMRSLVLGAAMVAAAAVGGEEYVSISGRVTDYRGEPVDSCAVCVSNPDFSTAYETPSYTRPMSVTKVRSYEDYMDKTAWEKHSNVTVEPEYMEFEVYVDGKKYDIISVQHLSLPNTNGNAVNDDCYLIQVPMPEDVHYRKDGNYEVRVVANNTQYDEWGESVCYLRPFAYRWGEVMK